jgi:pimeloyl-ACP methyl ester carboxylesterase
MDRLTGERAEQGPIEAWWAAGETVAVSLGGVQRRVFVQRMGTGPHITLLHGFPSCSFDWARIAGPLGESHSLLLPDLLGFGASEKPRHHDYTIAEQADLIETLWALDRVDATVIVAHDYSVTLAQELLARRAEGGLGVQLRQVHLTNGGLYPDLHRPEPAQIALLDPVQGPALAGALTAEAMAAVLAPTFAPEFDAAGDAHAIWRACERGGVVLDRLIAYIPDRQRHEDRWVGALEATDVPLTFTWGMLDPISGAHMAERIRERMPQAPLVALDDVGHWPPLEAPERLLATVRGAA